jgi:hypothetical protein
MRDILSIPGFQKNDIFGGYYSRYKRSESGREGLIVWREIDIYR